MGLDSDMSGVARRDSPKRSSSEISESVSTSGTGDRSVRWDDAGWMGRDDGCT